MGDCMCAPDPNLSGASHMGADCTVPMCFTGLINPYYQSYYCGGFGTCIDTNVCECQIGHGGYDCTKTDFKCFGKTPTDPLVCSGRGQCIDDDYCNCAGLYGGADCTVPKCNDFLATDSQVCYGNGQCIAPDQCSCKAGYSGTNCEIITPTTISNSSVSIVNSCFGNLSNESSVCSGHGSCLGDDYCSCEIGYTGLNCNETFCFGILQSSEKVCSGKGNCSTLNSCSCKSTSSKYRHVGNECEILQCIGKDLQFYNSTDPNVCSGRGECLDGIGCVCNKGYLGDSCEITSCFSVLSNETMNICSGHGICKDFDNCECYYNSTFGYWSGDDCSVCSTSYGGSNCSIELKCAEDSSCSGSGKCSSDYSCSCFDLFDGENCEKCTQDYYGPLCQNLCTSELNCSSHGDCSRDGGFCECYQSRELGYFQSHNCSTCSDGYFGKECLTFIASNFTFNKYGNEIILNIIPPLDINIPQTENMCKSFFSSNSQLLLGNEFTCQWIDVYHGYLKILIPRNATIIPGDILEFNIYAFENNQPAIIVYKTIVSYTSDVNNIITPYSNIEILSNYEKGKSIDIIGKNLIHIERERPLYYEWSIVNSALANSYVNAKSGYGISTITIPSNYTSNMQSITIKLRIANYYQKFGTEKIIQLTSHDSATLTSFKQIKLKILSLRNPLYITSDVFPYRLNTELTVNGAKISNILDSEYRIEWSLTPDLGKTQAGDTIILLKPITQDNASVLFTTEDVNNYYNLAPTFFNLTAKLYSKNNTNLVIVSDMLTVNFNILDIKDYTISITPNQQQFKADITATYPLVISLTISPRVEVRSIEWTCYSQFMYNGVCHEQYKAIIDQSANKTSISLPKSAVFLHYNMARFTAKITTKFYDNYQYVEISPTCGYFMKNAATETNFGLVNAFETFWANPIHGTTISFDYRLYDDTDAAVGASGQSPATAGTVTAFKVYDNSPITLSTPNGVYTDVANYRGGTNYARLVKVDTTKFTEPIYFQVKFTYNSLEMNMRQYLIIGKVPKETVKVNVNVSPVTRYPELRNYYLKIVSQPQHAFYEVKTTFSIRYKNSTSMELKFIDGMSIFDGKKDTSIGLPLMIDDFSIFQKVTYFFDTWTSSDHLEQNYIYEEELLHVPASPLSSDPYIKSMQLRLRESFAKGSQFIGTVISNINSYYNY